VKLLSVEDLNDVVNELAYCKNSNVFCMGYSVVFRYDLRHAYLYLFPSPPLEL